MNRNTPRLAARAGRLLLSASFSIATAIAGAGMAQGQSGPPPGGDGARRGPPPEAFEACEGLAEQDACPMLTPEGESVTGTCVATRDEQLACMPAGGPPMPGN